MNLLHHIDKIVIATHNQGKYREIAEWLKPYPIHKHSAQDFNLPEPKETGATFEENALLKAHATAQQTNEIALADDSGLCVKALNGAPGIYSARWATTNGGKRDFTLAAQRIWQELNKNQQNRGRSGSGSDNHTAYFVCVLALAFPQSFQLPKLPKEICFRGEVWGHIVWPPRGSHGFGYDPIFVPQGYQQTFGEMTPEKKHPISHRAAAFKKLLAAEF